MQQNINTKSRNTKKVGRPKKTIDNGINISDSEKYLTQFEANTSFPTKNYNTSTSIKEEHYKENYFNDIVINAYFPPRFEVYELYKFSQINLKIPVKSKICIKSNETTRVESKINYV